MDYKRSLVGYNCHNSDQSPNKLRITSEQAEANSQIILRLFSAQRLGMRYCFMHLNKKDVDNSRLQDGSFETNIKQIIKT